MADAKGLMRSSDNHEQSQTHWLKQDLQKRLERLQESQPIGSKGFTKAGIRKMVARLHGKFKAVIL